MTLSLPQPATPFIGRADERAQIAALLADPACRLLTLLGPGGIGKTRLAIQVAAEQVAAFPDGVYFVALAPLHETDDLVSAIASAVGFRFYGGADPEQQLLSYFRDKRLLLVLDNFEHLLARAELVATLLGHAPQIKLLVTSREALKLQEEWLRPVEGMSFPAQGQAADPASYSAVQLFVQRARQVRGDFSLAAEGAQAARICRLVAGMPLAVELAAAWVGLLSCAEIAAEIERSLDFLAASARNLPDRHRSIRAVFESTWERLDPAEQAVLARLALFRGPFDRSAADAVAGASLPILLALADKSLIRRARDGRFALHDLLRQFAGEKLDSDPEARESVQRRFAAYYGDRLARLEPDLKGPAQIAALDAIEAEIDHVRLAWMLAIGHRYDPARRRLLNGLVRFYTMRARLQESVEMLGGTLDYLHRQSLTAEERDLTALIEVFQALNLLRLSRNQQASALYQTAMPVVRQMDSPDAGYFFAALSTIALWGNGDPQAGAEWARRALALAQAADDPWGVALALRVLGETIHDSAHYPEARRLFSQALEASRGAGDRWGECEALDLLGRVAYTTGDYPEADRLYRAALAINQQLGNAHEAAWTRSNIGGVARALGEYAEARRAFEEVAAFGRQVGDKGMEAQMEFALGETALLLGEHTAARRCFERSLAAHACTETGDGVAWVHLYQGHLALDSGDPDTAAACGQRGILEMTQVNNPWGVASAHFLLGSALAARGELAAAGPHLLEALRLDLQQNSVNLSARHLIALARWLIARGDSIRALEVLETVRASSQSWRDSRTAAAQLADSLAASLPPAEVEAALARAARHDLLSLTADLLAHQAPAGPIAAPPAPVPEPPASTAARLLDPLTGREQEILALIGAGLSNAEIAARLVVGLSTVKKHVNHLYSKLDVTTREEAITRARTLGLL